MRRTALLCAVLLCSVGACSKETTPTSPDGAASGGHGGSCDLCLPGVGGSGKGGSQGQGGSGSSATTANGGSPGSGGAKTGGAPGTGGKTGAGGVSGTGGSSVARDDGATKDAPPAKDGDVDASLAKDGATEKDAAQATDSEGVCPTGYKLAWSDEFEGPEGPFDSSKWAYETGNGTDGWGNAELEYYQAQNAALDGKGNLVITAKKESAGGFSYTSARLKTQGKATWTYGRIEGRIKVPYGQGIWPAFWMLGADIDKNGWPACGEIDIMENIGKEPATLYGTLHMPAAGSSNDSQLGGSYTLKSGQLKDDFHTFAVDWSSSSIQFYFDGTPYGTYSPATATNRTWSFDKPFFILLNVAVGGRWPGSPDQTTTFPQTMTVDYVRVCQKI